MVGSGLNMNIGNTSEIERFCSIYWPIDNTELNINCIDFYGKKKKV